MQMLSPPVQLQRARGRAEVAVTWREGAVRLDRLYQQGCAKAMRPRVHGPVPEIVLLNTAGGLTGGDRVDYALTVGPGAALVATTQAAERVYRAASAGVARLGVRLEVGAGGALDWLPQETILFDGGRIERRLDVDLAADARATLLEILVLGRAAMGETVRTARYFDRWRVRRAGRLVHAEALRLDGDVGAATAGRATFGGARAVATLVRLAADAADRLDPVRARLDALAGAGGLEAAASFREGALIVRLLAPDAAPLRRAVLATLAVLRDGPPPRVWSL